jgi:protein-tyrosine phosphatase
MTATLAAVRILLVCLGNICRSPLAAAALRSELEAAGVADRVTVDSAGTGDWNLGKPPDPRMVTAASGTGLDVTGTARQIAAEDLRDSDLILVMDRQNLADVRGLAPDDATRDKIRLFLDYAGPGGEVPDPYYGADDGFTHVVALVRDAARTIAQRVASDLDASSASPPRGQNSGLGKG